MVCISNYYPSKKIFLPVDTLLRDTTPKRDLIIFFDLPERLFLTFPKIIAVDFDALKPVVLCPQEAHGIYYMIILYIDTSASITFININFHI